MELNAFLVCELIWQLEDAVKKKDLPETQSCYQGTAVILQEVMSRMA